MIGGLDGQCTSIEDGGFVCGKVNYRARYLSIRLMNGTIVH